MQGCMHALLAAALFEPLSVLACNYYLLLDFRTKRVAAFLKI